VAPDLRPARPIKATVEVLGDRRSLLSGDFRRLRDDDADYDCN
jgi:hypothetical protein